MSPEIKLEALRIAKGLVKDVIKANGLKLSCYTDGEIVAFAMAVVEDHPEKIIPQAWDQCKMRWEAKREAEESFANSAGDFFR